jgi:hypothetical protein
MNLEIVDSGKRIKFITKLFTWALITEPLIFFVFKGGETSGINLTLARLLQLFVIIYILVNNSATKILLIEFNKYIFKYIYIIIFGTTFGIFFFNSYISTISFTTQNVFITFFRGQYFRPFIEFFIFLYYLFIYLLLPKYIFKNKFDIHFFFKTFKLVLDFVLFFGFLDFLYSLIIPGGYLIGRHLTDNMYVGVRFHSFCGEPRDAFVFLIFAYVLLVIQSIYFNEKIKKKYSILIPTALILTQSASGILGFFFTIILLIFFTKKVNLKLIFFTFLFIILIITLSIILVNSSERLSQYFEVYKDIYNVLKSNEELPYLLYVQSVNIYPIWKLFLNIINLNFLPVLIGSGIGSSSFLNNSYIQVDDNANTNSQLVRLLYEVGLIGTFYFIRIFTSIYDTFNSKLFTDKKIFYYSFFLLIGSNLSHRSTTIFIVAGILLCLVKIDKQMEYDFS